MVLAQIPSARNLYLNLITKDSNSFRDILHGGKSEIDSHGEALGFLTNFWNKYKYICEISE